MNRYISLLAISATTGFAGAATIIENFEGVTAPNLPAGWSTVGSAAFTTAATGNPGNALQVGAATSSYFVNSGAAFDATQSFSGTFDFYLVESGNYTNIAFYLGDIQDGLTATSAGEFIRVDLREKTFGSRANLYAGDGSTLVNGANNNNLEIFTNQWNNASFTWTPTSGTTGNFTFSWIRPTAVSEPGFSITGYTFDSANVYFGFGTNQHAAQYDNINLTGSEVIPEPSITLLGSLGLLGLLRRRR